MSNPPPEWIGPYRILRRLGRGGMGEVFLAHDSRLERRVAIKRIRTDSALGDEHRARFRREARLAARLNHPSVVQVYDLLEDDASGSEHIVMEYVAGETLAQRLRGAAESEKELPFPWGLSVARAVVAGLAYAHRHGIVHRDLKTENVLLGSEGEVKIADFGVARLLVQEGSGDSLTKESHVAGTVRVMSPEQLRGEPVDARSDLFSLGVLFYELFVGTSPFLAGSDAETVRRIHQDRPPAADVANPALPAALARIIDHLLEKDPPLRPRDAEEIRQGLDRLAESLADDEVTRGLTLTGLSGTPLLSSGSSTRPERVSQGRGPILSRDVSSGGVAPGADERRPDWAVAAGTAAGLLALLVLAVATFRLGPWPSRDGKDPPAVRSVAVLEPAFDPIAGAEVEGLAAAVRNAALRTLVALAGIRVEAPAEVDAVPGPPSAVARALAVDEWIAAEIACPAADCRLTLSRAQSTGSTVLWLDQIEIPRDDPLVAARATAVLLRRAYGEYEARPGALEWRISAADYAAFLEVERAARGGAQDGSQDAAELLARLEEIEERAPEFLDALLLDAELSIHRFVATRRPERLERADRRVERALELAPEDPEVHLTRAWVEIHAERLAEAERASDAFARLAPGDVRALDLEAALLEKRQRGAAALEVAAAAVARQPSWERLYRYAQMAIRRGEPSLARQSLEALLERFPSHRQSHWLLAWLELVNGDPARAAKLYGELAERSQDGGIWVNLGLAHLLLEDWDAAAEAIAKAVETAPRNPLYLLNLADARALQGRAEEAAALYRHVLELLDEDPGGESWQELSVRAQALAHLGRDRAAVASVQRALQLAPDNAQMAFEATLVYSLTGDRTAALVNAERALELGFQRRFFELPWLAEIAAELQ